MKQLPRCRWCHQFTTVQLICIVNELNKQQKLNITHNILLLKLSIVCYCKQSFSGWRCELVIAVGSTIDYTHIIVKFKSLVGRQHYRKTSDYIWHKRATWHKSFSWSYSQTIYLRPGFYHDTSTFDILLYQVPCVIHCLVWKQTFNRLHRSHIFNSYFTLFYNRKTILLHTK